MSWPQTLGTVQLHSTALQLYRAHALHASSVTCSASVCIEVRVAAGMLVPVDNLYLPAYCSRLCAWAESIIGVELVGIKMQHILLWALANNSKHNEVTTLTDSLCLATSHSDA